MIVRVIGFDAAQPAGLRDATSFNQPLNNWNVSNVEDTAIMFYGARSFNQPLNNWNVSNVETMKLMFVEATSFRIGMTDSTFFYLSRG